MKCAFLKKRAVFAIFLLLFFPAHAHGWIEGGFDKFWEEDDKKEITTPEKNKSGIKHSGEIYTEPITGMEFVFVKGVCYKMAPNPWWK